MSKNDVKKEKLENHFHPEFIEKKSSLLLSVIVVVNIF